MSDETTTAAELATNAEPPPAPDGQAPEAEALQQQIEKLQTQSAEYLDGWQRARAEFANYKRRVEKWSIHGDGSVWTSLVRANRPSC